MLRQLDENLWVAEMPASRAGFEFGARMTVVKLTGGKLWIHSPIELTIELQRQLDAIGEVGYVVSPSQFHYLHLQDFWRVYPEAKYFAAPKFNIKKLPEVKFSARLKDKAEPAWESDLDQIKLRGSALYDEVDFYHRASRTLILTDLLFNMPRDRGTVTNIYAKVLGVLDRVAPSPSFRLTMRNRTLAQQTVQRILEWDFDRIILSHGEVVESGGKVLFENAFAKLCR